jgi:hypothetical protein
MPFINIRASLNGAIAQLGERNTGSVEVGGSIPPGSTKLLEKSQTDDGWTFIRLPYPSPSSSRPRIPAFHAGDRGSNPLGDAIFTPVSSR